MNTRQSVTLAGSGSNPENQPLNYQWQQVSGSNVTINNATNPQASFTTPSTAGTLEFSLTITDDFGLANSANVSVTVVAAVQSTSSSSGGGSLDYWLLMGLLCIALMRNMTVSHPKVI